MEDLGLSDTWRLHNLAAKEYSYFSAFHRTFSRIDFFLSSNSIVSDITNTISHLILISDHAPVTLDLNDKQFHRPRTRWYFHTSLLKDPDFDSFLKREWASFMEMNDSPDTSPTLIWETAKTVIRGRIISYSSHKKKKKENMKKIWKTKLKAEKINVREVQPKTNSVNLENIIFNKIV